MTLSECDVQKLKENAAIAYETEKDFWKKHKIAVTLDQLNALAYYMRAEHGNMISLASVPMVFDEKKLGELVYQYQNMQDQIDRLRRNVQDFQQIVQFFKEREGMEF